MIRSKHLFAIAALASCSPLPTTEKDAAADDASFDSTTLPDAATDADASVEAGPTCDAGETLCSGACVQLSTSANCSACGQACTLGSQCVDGACTMQTLFQLSADPTQFFAANSTSLFWTDGPIFMSEINVGSMDGGAAIPLVQNVWNPNELVADSNNAYYSQNFISNGNAFSVMQLPLDGGAPQPLTSPASQISALAINSTTVFYATNNDAKIWSVPIGGTTATPILTNLTGLLDHLAADDNYVYWANGQTITQATVLGANVTPLSVATGTISSIIVDATSVYYASLSDGIYVVPIGGGSTTRLGNFGMQLQQDATNLYFVQNDAKPPRKNVVRMAKSGGAQVIIAADSPTYPIYPQFTALGPSMFYAYAGTGFSSGFVISATPK